MSDEPSTEPTTLPAGVLEGLTETLTALREASALIRHQHRVRLLSQVDVLTDTRAGLQLLRDRIAEIDAAGVFEGGPWEDPDRLVAPLVSGTLRAGGQTTLMEILSELRILAISEGEIERESYSAQRARGFLREVMVNSLDLLFPGDTEEDRTLDPGLRTKIDHLMHRLSTDVPLERIKDALGTEIELICLQRPIVTDRALRIIRLVHREIDLDATDVEDNRLLRFVEAVYAPSPEAGTRDAAGYEGYLRSAGVGALEEECRKLSGTMRDTGLAVDRHALLVRRVVSEPELLSRALGLDRGGRAELEKHHAFVRELVDEAVHPSSARAVYGLSRLLDRGVLSHQPVRTGLERIESLDLHPRVQRTIERSRPDSLLEARQLLLADTLCVLGQPLGIGQGRNPTCQSARGISLWSRHAPGKLLDMIRTAAATNDLAMRFEGATVRASKVAEGLLKEKEQDNELDAVSLVLVPHLDRIYNEMMRRAAHRGEDPHKWVNPAMYGHWIPTGFISAYHAPTGMIQDYDRFLRTFYATHHPDFNRGHDLAYPNPVGIFLTSSSGALIGFHAVSILRVRVVDGEARVFLLNPNTEGRQRWHSDISPTVAGNGEEPGESSLPFDQFASRLYAFHFQPSDVGDLDAVDDEVVSRVARAARESWGRSYTWIDPAGTHA